MSSDKLKVFAIVPSSFCFGLQYVTIDFFKRFKNTDSLFLVTGWNNGDFIRLLNENHLKHTISWLGMFSRHLDWRNIKMSLHALSKVPRLYYDFYKCLKTFKPDVLFFANHHELILLYPVLKFVKTPVVCHMHDPAPAIPFQIKTFKRYGSVVTRFIAISDSVRQRTIDLGCDPKKIITIHNGIDVPQQLDTINKSSFIKKYNWADDVFIVGITGQMTATKGHTDLLAAFKKAYQVNPKVRLVIGGIAIEPLYSELKQTVQEWALENVVIFSGWQDSVNDFFSNIDLFVLASRHDEGYGLVVAEAMAHNLPVVITNSGGAVEIVQDNISGYIVPKGGIDLMSEKILFLSNNPLLCKEMGMKGRQRIATAFNIGNQAVLFEQNLLEIKNNAIRK
jgi:glycosyltransferase involved in cell wall biosynthesis